MGFISNVRANNLWDAMEECLQIHGLISQFHYHNGAISNSTQFRWYQTPTPGGSATGFDNWALDDVNISCASSINNYVYQWTPASNLLYPDSLNTDLFVPSSSGIYNYNLTCN